MNIYHSDIIYSADPNTRELNERYDTDEVQPVDRDDVVSGKHVPFWCTGIGYLDLLVKGVIIDEDGAEDADYLVSTYTANQAAIVPVEVVATDPLHYLSREMAKRIVTLSRLEAKELRLDDAIFTELDRKFPGIQPFTPR